MAGQQRRLGMGLVEIFDDCERLREDLPILVERRDETLRVHREIGRRALVVAAQMDEGPLIGQAFQVERDADAKGGRGAKEIVELHGVVIPAAYGQLRARGARRQRAPRSERLPLKLASTQLPS